MARFGAEFSIAGVNSADAVLFNLLAGSVDALIEQIFFEIEVASTNAPIYGLKRMSGAGTGAITNASALAFDPSGNAATAALQTAWVTTRPTVTGGSLRGAVPNAIGNGFLFDFTNRPLLVRASGGLCGVMRNASGTTTGTHGGYVIWSE